MKGRGRHSHVKGHGVLQSAVTSILGKIGVRYTRDPSNNGRLMISLSEIRELQLRRNREKQKARMIQSLALRAMVMVCGTYGVIAAIAFLKDYTRYMV